MFNIGFTEMIVLVVLALILIGPKQLPEVARTVGRFLNEIKRSTETITDEFRSARGDFRYDEPPAPQPMVEPPQKVSVQDEVEEEKSKNERA